MNPEATPDAQFPPDMRASDRVYSVLDANYQLVMYNPTACTSPDLFSKHLVDCDLYSGMGWSAVDIPYNKFGEEDLRVAPNLAIEHKRYAGLFSRYSNRFFDPAFANFHFWREFVQVELLHPLVQGRTYTLTYWVSLGESSNSKMQLHARLSPQPFSTGVVGACNGVAEGGVTAITTIPVTPNNQYVGHVSPVLDNVIGWTQITTQIVANGGEKFLTIGHFEQNQDGYRGADYYTCGPWYEEGVEEISYLYIDDVSLTEEVECECPVDPEESSFSIQVTFKSFENAEGACCAKVKFEYINSEWATLCNVYEIKVTEVGATTPSLLWSTTDVGQSISSDGYVHDLGEICFSPFHVTDRKHFKIELRNSNGDLFCTTYATMEGCDQDECCQGVLPELKRVKVGSNECCLKLSLSEVGLTCPVYRVTVSTVDIEFNETIHADHQPTTPLSSGYTGELLTFCPTTTALEGFHVVLVKFYDSEGNVICRNLVPLPPCDCHCRSGSGGEVKSPMVELIVEMITNPNGTCCYRVRMKSNVFCNQKVKSVKMDLNSAISFVEAMPGWSIANQTGAFVTVVPTSGSFTMYPDGIVDIATFCVSSCLPFMPFDVKLHITFGEEPELCPVSVPTNPLSSGTLLCGPNIDCDSFSVVVETNYWPSTLASPPHCMCCYSVYVSIFSCVIPNNYSVEVVGYGQSIKSVIQPNFDQLGSGPLHHLAHEFCVLPGETRTYRVRLLRPDGTEVCFKDIVLGPCQPPSTCGMGY